MSSRTIFRDLGFILALFLLFGFCQDSIAQTYSEGDIANDFTLMDVDGNEVSLYDYEGYAIFINFFGVG